MSGSQANIAASTETDPYKVPQASLEKEDGLSKFIDPTQLTEWIKKLLYAYLFILAVSMLSSLFELFILIATPEQVTCIVEFNCETGTYHLTRIISISSINFFHLCFFDFKVDLPS